MTTRAPQIDLETLLSPISEASPCGDSLRYEGTYDRIREARREDDPSLPMGDWETKLKVADHSLVDKLCREALQKKSKDLQIACWLAETWLRRYRARGLSLGLSLVAELCDRYWEGLYPLLGDDGDASARVALVEWMDEVFSERLRITPFADAGEGASFTLLDWERAGQTSVASSESDEGDGAPRPTRESLLAKISLGGGTPWSALVEDVSSTMASSRRLEEVLAARLERPPTMRRVRDVLSVIDNLARDGARISGEVLPGHAVSGSEDVAAFEASSGGSPSREGGPRLGGAGPITSRADAYYRLAEAAEYLLRTEPHSPVPYLVKRAVGWGNMSLAELLYEFVGNADDLVAIQRLLGMRGKEE